MNKAENPTYTALNNEWTEVDEKLSELYRQIEVLNNRRAEIRDEIRNTPRYTR
uniref:Uncharacterized protein n=1 Tax=Micrococcus phage Olihed TaxID=3092209 RepID=A0AAU6R5Z4_9CAUD